MSDMKTTKEHVSREEARLTITSMNGFGENLGTFPVEVIVEILSRLPAKSIARFRTVSKTWASLLRDPYFTNKFLTISSARPRLLFTFQTEGKWSFFSSPQCLISGQNSSLVVVDNHMDISRDRYSFRICVPVCGMLCTKDERISSKKMDTRMMICNPSTGLSTTLPKVRTRRTEVKNYIGYDPIEKQYKVLCMTIRRKPHSFKAEEHQVLTLGTSNLKWRMIECSVIHDPLNVEICINGILYYVAIEFGSNKAMIVCFDVRSENFQFIMDKSPVDIGFPSALVNYKDKLGAIHLTQRFHVSQETKQFELWFIEDAAGHKWSKYVYELPALWRELVGDTSLDIVGMIGTSEIVFAPFILSNPFYTFHLNMEKNSIKRVEIQGIGPLEGQRIFTFINHVENVNRIM